MKTIPCTKPKVEVIFASDGIEVVRLYGADWLAQPSAMTLYNQIAPFIRQIHLILSQSSNTHSQSLP